MDIKNKNFLQLSMVVAAYSKYRLKIQTASLLVMALLSACTQPADETDIKEPPVSTNEIVIYSPAPSKIMLHQHNVELGDVLNTCGISREVRVIAMPLPDSINVINKLDAAVKPYHLPIVTTLDFKTAVEANAPEWHGYNQKNPDLKFVASLYDVAYGLQSVDVSIKSPADLVGKRIAVPARPSAVRWFSEVLLRDGWNILDQVTLVDIVPPKVPAAIAKGEIDALAWNIMSETPDGYRPLLPMVFNNPNIHWFDIDLETAEAINAANPFTIAQTEVQLDRIIGVNNEKTGKSVNLLSFKQALAAWTSTPDELVDEIVSCLSKTAMPFGSGDTFANTQFDWPGLEDADIHPAVKAARN